MKLLVKIISLSILLIFPGCISQNRQNVATITSDSVNTEKHTEPVKSEIATLITLNDPVRHSELVSTESKKISAKHSFFNPLHTSDIESVTADAETLLATSETVSDKKQLKSEKLKDNKISLKQETPVKTSEQKKKLPREETTETPENQPGNNESSDLLSAKSLNSIAEAVTSHEYRLKRGDDINISVFNEPDMTRTVTVLPDGNINYSLIGNVKAINKTFEELATDITIRLKDFFHDPLVSINPETLSRGAKYHVIIRGAVRYPGRYEIETGDRVLEMIAATEGLLYAENNTIMADFGRCRLYRDGKAIEIDFEPLLKNEDFSDNILLRDGDLIYLPPDL